MLGKIFSVMIIISVLCGITQNNMEQVNAAMIEGIADAVKISFSLLGMMCFWCGIMRVLDKSGVTAFVLKLIKPVLKLIYKTDTAFDEISASFGANLLGLGNAALPAGIRAMKKMKCNDSDAAAGDDMIMFSVLNTVPLQLVPTTLIALRSMHGSISPFEIVLPVWLCSVLTTIFAVLVCKSFAFALRRR